MGMWGTIKMTFWATGWILTNPIKTALCLVALFLLVKGVIYMMNILLRPSTYGLGRSNQGNAGSSEGRSPSIFTVGASAILILVIGCLGYSTVELHRNYSILSDSFERIALELNRLIDTIESRGKDFHRGLITLNDSILESYVNLFGKKGSEASDEYAFQMEAALRATQDLDHKAQRFAPLLRQLRHSHALLHADQRHYSTMFPHPMVDKNFEELSLLIFFEEMDSRLQVIIEDLERGSSSLEKYLGRAKEYQPSPEVEARDIKQAIEKDILDAFTKRGTIKIINTFNLSEFEAAIHKIRHLTVNKARGTSFKLKYLAHHGIIATLAASTATIFALFMNRFRWPLLGLLYADHVWHHITLYRSLVGFMLLFGMEVVRDQYFGGLASTIEQFCSSSVKHDNMVVAQLFDLPIKKNTIARFVQECGKRGSLPSAFHAAFGSREILKGTIKADQDGMTIRFKKHDLLFIPQRLEDIKATFVEAHGRAIHTLLENGQELKQLIKDYQKVAESCSSEALLKFPKSWRVAMVRVPKVLSWLEAMTRRLEGFRRMEGTGMLARHSREFTILLNSVNGLTKTVMHISDRLMDACKAQKEAIRGLERAGSTPDPSQYIRLAALGSKAHTMMVPIFDVGFVTKPAERCIKEACGRVRENIEKVRRSNNHMVLALGVGAVAVIFVVGVPSLLMRGALFMVPCLEIGDSAA